MENICREKIRELLLSTLNTHGEIKDSSKLLLENGSSLDQSLVSDVIKSLSGYEIVSFKALDLSEWHLTSEGAVIAEKGSHEARVFYSCNPGPNVPANSGPVVPLQGMEPLYSKVGQNTAFKNKWIERDASTGVFFRAVSQIDDHIQKDLKLIQNSHTHPNPETLEQLKKRKLIELVKKNAYNIKKGPCFTLERQKLATDLDSTLLESGAWKTLDFKPYNFDVEGLLPKGGHLHPLLKVKDEFKKLFFEMGFIEMPTNNYVESSFWNFDALFQPQHHPSRDAHDTFFLNEPQSSSCFPSDYLERVRQIHTSGGYQSIGYQYPWLEKEAQKNILRTHTTAVSARMLYKLAHQPCFTPTKYFSIDRVFRNETLDSTHLAEFHQVEGLIADYNLTLGDLMGVLEAFFKKLGMTQLKFKPAYNPYTEPSLEVFSYHPGLGKWIEIGNSGMFRPEMLRPLGFDENVTVIAWGLSLERPTMIKYGISNIRDLVGHKVDLSLVHQNPICRLEKLYI